MYINTFKYQPSDVSCQLCTEYVKKQGCTASRCPWLKERIEAGVVGYREAVFETMPRDRALYPHLCMLVKSHPVRSGAIFSMRNGWIMSRPSKAIAAAEIQRSITPPCIC